MRLAFTSWGARGLGAVLMLALAAAACGGGPEAPSFVEPTPPTQNPTTAPPATPGFTIAPGSGTLTSTVRVTLTGTGFAPGMSVTVGGLGVTVQNVAVTSNTTIQADLVIDGWTAALGGRTVTVGTAAAISGSVPFTVEAGARFVDLGGAVRDTLWNLIWEKKLPGVVGRDPDDAYTWCEATGDARPPACAGRAFSWIDTIGPTFGDRRVLDGWRVPTRQELTSIVKAPCPTPSGAVCIDPVFGPTVAGDYWSSEESSDTTAYLVGFYAGQVVTRSKTERDANRARAVRSGP